MLSGVTLTMVRAGVPARQLKLGGSLRGFPQRSASDADEPSVIDWRSEGPHRDRHRTQRAAPVYGAVRDGVDLRRRTALQFRKSCPA